MLEITRISARYLLGIPILNIKNSNSFSKFCVNLHFINDKLLILAQYAKGDAIARRADSLNVQYDPTFGYPTQINIDYSRQIADEELFLTIENFAKSANFNKPNVFKLSGDSVQVSYSDTSVLGGPRLNYRDKNINRTFTGQEIRIQETEIGQLITVTLEQIPDLRTVTFTLILPLVNLSTHSETIRIRVPSITTTTHTTIAGSGVGAEKTYTTVNLRGTAQFIVS